MGDGLRCPQTLIAIKAPSGTTLAVPYPDESVALNRRKYQIFLKSNDGPVDIYLVNSPHVSRREKKRVAGATRRVGAARLSILWLDHFRYFIDSRMC